MSAYEFIGDVEEIMSSEHPEHQRRRLIKEAYEKNNVPREDGNTLLHMLIHPLLRQQLDSQQALAAAIAAGAKLDALNKQQSTPLHVAAKYGSGATIKTLIEAGAQLESANKDQKTPLYIAAEDNHFVAVEELLVAGANVDSAAKYGILLLEVAMKPRSSDMQQILHEAFAKSRTVTDEDGNTLLHLLARKVDGAPTMAGVISAGAEVDAVNKANKTPLCVATESMWDAILVETNLEANNLEAKKNATFGELLVAGANPDLVGKPYGFRLLDYALSLHHGSQRANHVHAAVGKSSVTDKHGNRLLHLLAQKPKELDAVKVLAAAGAKLDAINKDGDTALHLAASRSYTWKTVKALLVAGAEITVYNKSGKTPLDCAIMDAKSKESVHCFLDHTESNCTLEELLLLAKPMHAGKNAVVKWPTRSSCVGIVERRIIARVMSEGTEDAKDVSITVIGPAGSGKSTLIEVLQHPGVLEFLQRLLRGKETCEDTGYLFLAGRTKGISIISYVDALGNIVHFKDLAGQEDFAACHSIFDLSMDGPNAALIVVNGSLDPEQIKQDLEQAAGHLISRGCYDIKTGKRKVLEVGVVFTRADPISVVRKKQLMALFEQLRNDTKGYLSLDFCSCIDARRCLQQSTCELRGHLSCLCAKLLKGAKQAAFLRKFCDVMAGVQSDLGKPVTTMKQFAAALHKRLDTKNLRQANVIIKQNIQLMVTLALIVTFKDSPRLQELVVNDPSWLLHDIVGAVFSPKDFPGPRVNFDDGKTSKSQFITDLRKCAPDQGDDVADMLVELGLVIEKGDDIIAPGKLPESARILGSWESPDSWPVVCGLALRCHSLASFPAGLVTRLLARLYNYFTAVHGGHTVVLSRNVINVRPANLPAEGLVRFELNMLNAWVIARAPAGKEHYAFYLLEFLQQQFVNESIRIRFSPEQSATSTSTDDWQSSLPYRTHVVSPASVKEQLKTTDSAVNCLDMHSPAAEIAHMSGEELLISYTFRHREKVASLLHCQPKHLRVISDDGRWALEASLSNVCAPALAQDLRMQATSDERAFDLLQRWALLGFSHTTSKLIDILSSSQASQDYGPLVGCLRREEEWLCRAMSNSEDVLAYQQKGDRDSDEVLVEGLNKGAPAPAINVTDGLEKPLSQLTSTHHAGAVENPPGSPQFTEPLPPTGSNAARQSTEEDNPWDHPMFGRAFGMLMEANTDSLRLHAVSAGLITRVEQRELQAILSPLAHNEKLIGYISNGGLKSFETLLTVLDKMGQSYDPVRQQLEDLLPRKAAGRHGCMRYTSV